ncbi:hypothetical protein F4775DRAFT_598309 [Biscogniauxia sp. FL1348]|nr:hypothetical protein F4775DRAFT_598309 [Biscogniauxia sp. FL1348]
MPVTELAFLPSATPGEVPAALLREGTAALEAQDQWWAENCTPITPTTTTITAPSNSTGETKQKPHREQRGAAFYQQREDGGDGGVVLVTAHWASVNQHRAWIASAANRDAMARLAPLLGKGKGKEVRLFHVRDAQMFTPETLGAAVVSVARARVSDVRVFEEGRGKSGAGVGGWRIEKGEEGEEEEYVLVQGWESEEEADRWAEGGGGFAERFGALMDVVVKVDVKTYRRIL